MVKLLSARDLHFAYPGGAPLLAGVDLDLGAGELLVLCGPNGSGKTTLLKLLGGSLQPARGELQLTGRALSDLSLVERARVLARVPQSLRGLPDASVRHFVMGGRYAHVTGGRRPGAADRTAVDAALADTELDDFAERSLNQLSGGQRQRALLARALAGAAQVLLVDEPTNALDPVHQLHTLSRLAELARGGRGVLVVTHDLALAGQFADRVLLLDGGRVCAAGTPAEVLRPEVLAPVYGEHLHYGAMPDGRVYVLPWLHRDGAEARAPDAEPDA
ncbi:MAG: hemin import ATP-binding protein HmuV [Planctomycetota bacterium]|nr:MAG: hemin import ATP-binding protein HmuV [Planctomycetota bacterium]